MRVNVLHPMFLSDQHLVAEYREVKMGPKALSRSLHSVNGVNKNKISPVYTLNTGHTYFFYDKNLFLDKRLAQIVDEMVLRGFQTNFRVLMDSAYTYHSDTLNPDWWNDWVPTTESLILNLERIRIRIDQRRGWYKFWSKPIKSQDDIFKIIKEGTHLDCRNCNAINTDQTICWNCGETDLVINAIR